MFKKIWPFFLFLLTLPSFAQDFVLTGTVVDENNSPVIFSNVVLYNTDDLSIADGTTTNEDGAFKLEHLKPNNYILKLSYLGFEENNIDISFTKSIDIGIIVLKEKVQALDGITIIAKRPTVSRLVDRLVFNVENSTLSNNNVLDVLKHTPGVLVNYEKISIQGQVPTVYINDRKVHLSSNEIKQLLEGTSATNIKSIEVITSPPARYEAEGAAVLNIVTSKNIIAGYSGSIFGDFKQGSEYPKYSIGTSHFFKSKKLNSYINYNVSPKKEFREDSEFVNFINNEEITSSWITNKEKTQRFSNQNINANFDYNISNNNAIGLSTYMLISPRDNTKVSENSITEIFNSNNELDSLFNTVNNSVEEVFNIAFTLDYEHRFKREGEKLSANVHHTNYDFSNFQDVNTGYFFPNTNSAFRNNKFQTFSSQEIKIVTGQIDYELPISDSAQFEAGGKISDINSESIINQFFFENEERVEDLQNSDIFIYDEVNYAVYSSYSKDWEKWSLKSGLRLEHTDVTGNSIVSNLINKKSYFKFFPSFHLLNKLNDNNELYFKYNKRINRPNYKHLNPFKYFLNDNAYVTGDPNLVPEIDDILTLGYTFNKKYTFELYYRFEKDPTSQIAFQDNNDNIIKHTYTNLKNNITYGLDFTTYTQMLPDWNIYILSSVHYYKQQFFALESNNELLANKKWSIYAQINNYFTLLKDKSLTADISFLYKSPFVDGPSDISSQFGIDFNLRKALWNNKAILSIGITDFFDTKNNYTETIKYLNQDIIHKPKLENRLFVLGFIYKFGNYKLQNNKKDFILNERERLNEN